MAQLLKPCWECSSVTFSSVCEQMHCSFIWECLQSFVKYKKHFSKFLYDRSNYELCLELLKLVKHLKGVCVLSDFNSCPRWGFEVGLPLFLATVLEASPLHLCILAKSVVFLLLVILWPLFQGRGLFCANVMLDICTVNKNKDHLCHKELEGCEELYPKWSPQRDVSCLWQCAYGLQWCLAKLH